MPQTARLWEALTALTPGQLALAVSIASALMFLIEERRLALLSLLAQYPLIGLILGGLVQRPVLYLFAGIGAAVSLVLWLSAGRVQQVLSAPPSPGEGSAPRAAPGLFASEPVLNAMVLILAGVSAYGAWRAYPIAAIPPALNLSGYWLLASGLLLALIGREPLRVGLGLITFINGLASIYLLLERSLVAFALLGVLYGVLALATVACTETWVAANAGEGR